MIMAIVRVAVVNSTRQSPEIAWLYFWSNLEVGVGMFHSRTEVQVDSHTSQRSSSPALLPSANSLWQSMAKLRTHHRRRRIIQPVGEQDSRRSQRGPPQIRRSSLQKVVFLAARTMVLQAKREAAVRIRMCRYISSPYTIQAKGPWTAMCNYWLSKLL
jgi:hypothetical protein